MKRILIAIAMLGMAGGAYAGVDMQRYLEALRDQGSIVSAPAPAPVPEAAPPIKSAAGRELTPGEKDLLRVVFRDGVDYSTVRIYRGKWFVLQPDNTIMSPNGNIYYPEKNQAYSEDFSRDEAWRKTLLVHEMTHVYQYQQGVNVIRRRLHEGGEYIYTIAPNKDFNDYTVEQQANMAAYYYNCLDSQKGFDPCGAYYFPEDAEKCRERARVWRAANNCVDKFRPALNNFITDPNYLRKAEEERRRQTGSGGGLDNDLIKQAGSNNVNSF